MICVIVLYFWSFNVYVISVESFIPGLVLVIGMKNGVLAIVSHPDDETFGCGATLAKHVQSGVEANVLCLTCSSRGRARE